MKPWDGIVSEEDQKQTFAAGFGRPGGVGKRLVQGAGVRAAEASGVEKHDVVGRLRDHHVVEPDLAELVHHHRRVGEGRVLERLVEQRRLAAAEEAGEKEERSFLLQHRVAQPGFAESFSMRG